MTNETPAQKIARLKALREARDGTPEQIAAAQRRLRGIEAQVRINRQMYALRCTVAALVQQHDDGNVPQSVRAFING
jgi:hypothetical protein